MKSLCNLKHLTLLDVLIVLIILILNLSSGTVYADSTSEHRFSIRYLGITVASVAIINEKKPDGGELFIRAQSTSAGKFLFPINNLYHTAYSDDYLPDYYHKDIKQRNFSLKKTATFDKDTGKVEIIDSLRTVVIDRHPEGRDFFSSLFVLNKIIHTSSTRINETTGSIVVYANNNYWLATCNLSGTELLNKKETIIYKFVLSRLTDNEYHRSDVLTNNIIKDDVIIYLWFSPDYDALPVKAEFKSSPFSVFWYLQI